MTRRLIAYGIQGLILFFVLGGLVYNVVGIRNWVANHFAHSITDAVVHSTPTPTR